jgi:MFS family permease
MMSEQRVSLFRDSRFRLLWVGQSISMLGSQFSALALPVLAVTVLNATSAQLGYLSAAETACFLLVGLIAGAWVDRWIKRKVMLVADLIRFVALLAIPALWASGHLQMWNLFVVAGIVGLATVFFDVAGQSLIPVLFKGEQIGQVNSATETSHGVTSVGGPSLVGFLLGIFKAPMLILVDAISFAISAVTLAFLKDGEVKAPVEARRPLRIEIAEGLQFVRKQKIIRTILLTTATGNFSGNIMFALFPLFALKLLGLAPATLGFVFSAGAVGGLIGAAVCSRSIKLVGEGRLVVLSSFMYSLAILAIPMTSLLPASAHVPWLIGAEFVNSFFVLTYNITQVSARQRICPPELLGRMNATIRFFIWGVMPIGALIGGWLGGAIGVIPTMWLGATGVVLSTSFIFFSPLRSMLKLPEQATL